MNVAVQCMILLVCMGLSIKSCQCVKMSKSVQPSLIADVKVYNPRPYCSSQEVIAVLKDKSLRCLDPKGKFTQAVLQTIQM
uniref:Chemokine (C-X-C motif) ligand 11, duplicate 5 n=1 Tax=Mastacembelus armatus TaxID=205130 RepID=A0A3Q3M4W2_9TELE